MNADTSSLNPQDRAPDCIQLDEVQIAEIQTTLPTTELDICSLLPRYYSSTNSTGFAPTNVITPTGLSVLN